MDVRSEAAEGAAHILTWRAEVLAGLKSPHTRPREIVPAKWTAWLLMEKAGMSRRDIAHYYGMTEGHVGRRLDAATAAMIWAPYAARIEALAGCMPRYRQEKGRLLAMPARGRALA